MASPLSTFDVRSVELLKRSEFRQLIHTAATKARDIRLLLPTLLFYEKKKGELSRVTGVPTATIHVAHRIVAAATGAANGNPWRSKYIHGSPDNFAAIKITLPHGDSRFDELISRLSDGPADVTVNVDGKQITLSASRPDRPRLVTLRVDGDDLFPEEIFAALVEKIGDGADLLGTKMARANGTGVFTITLPVSTTPAVLLAEPWLTVDGKRVLVQFPAGAASCGVCFKTGHRAATCPDKPPPPHCSSCDRDGHTLETCWRRDTVCHKCDRTGHIRNYCPDERCTSCGAMGHRATVCEKVTKALKQAGGARPRRAVAAASSGSHPHNRSVAQPAPQAADANAEQPRDSMEVDERVGGSAAADTSAAATAPARHATAKASKAKRSTSRKQTAKTGQSGAPEGPTASGDDGAGGGESSSPQTPATQRSRSGRQEATGTAQAAGEQRQQPAFGQVSATFLGGSDTAPALLIPENVSEEAITYVLDFTRRGQGATPQVRKHEGDRCALVFGEHLPLLESLEDRTLNIQIAAFALHQLGSGIDMDTCKAMIENQLRDMRSSPPEDADSEARGFKRGRNNGTTPPGQRSSSAAGSGGSSRQ
jgi:hypothetical protein